MKSVSIKTDTAPFEKALDDLRLDLETLNVSERLLEVVKSLFDGSRKVELACLEQQATPSGTRDLIIVLKPSDKLIEFMAALRTSDGNLLTSDIERIFHNETSNAADKNQ